MESEAKAPFRIEGDLLRDANDRVVLRCSEMDELEGELQICSKLWNSEFIDANPHFMCPVCGRLAIRMTEARRMPKP